MAPEAEDGSISKKGKQKVSRKERIQRKRDQKRAERQAGSDDEDLGQGELSYTTCHTSAVACLHPWVIPGYYRLLQ